jgi:hypothetical protein
MGHPTCPQQTKENKIKPVIEDWGSSKRENRYEEIVTCICRMRISHTRATHNFLFKGTPKIPGLENHNPDPEMKIQSRVWIP